MFNFVPFYKSVLIANTTKVDVTNYAFLAELEL